jgi:hypothetical protein
MWGMCLIVTLIRMHSTKCQHPGASTAIKLVTTHRTVTHMPYTCHEARDNH